MKRKHVMILLGLFAVLLFLQFSCSTKKEYRDESTPAEIMETDQSPLLLADKHKTSGLECTDCHGEAQSDSAVTEETCIACHEDYKELDTSGLDLHNSHIVSSGCDDCHHAHKTSELICQGCHIFDIQVP